MKKIFLVLSVALFVVACKNPGDKKVSDKDTVDVVVKDTMSVVKDTVITVDTLK